MAIPERSRRFRSTLAALLGVLSVAGSSAAVPGIDRESVTAPADVVHAPPGGSPAPVAALPGGGRVTVGLGGSGFRSAPASGHLYLAYHFPSVWRGVRPTLGTLGSWVGDSFHFAGLSGDLPHGRWGLTPQFVVGGYVQGGGMNLGGALEFRTTFEVYRVVRPTLRLGISWNHISNAGFFDRNPGRESLFLTMGILR